MKVYYDFEFIEDGNTIDPISVGMVAENGDEYYAVNSDMPIERIREHDWLIKNVISNIPNTIITWHDTYPPSFVLDTTSVLMKPKWVIANEVREWLGKLSLESPLELWAWYGAYDHVALAQLFGPMANLPKHIPMWTNDLRQTLMGAEKLLGRKLTLPEQSGRIHNALEDARFNRVRHQWLRAQMADTTTPEA